METRGGWGVLGRRPHAGGMGGYSIHPNAPQSTCCLPGTTPDPCMLLLLVFPNILLKESMLTVKKANNLEEGNPPKPTAQARAARRSVDVLACVGTCRSTPFLGTLQTRHTGPRARAFLHLPLASLEGEWNTPT